MSSKTTTTIIKRTNPLTLVEVRRDMLRNEVGVSVDYYPPGSGTDNHCRWVCTDRNCKKCGDCFNTYPKFLKHLRIYHNIEFCEMKMELLMRQKYHYIK